MRGAGSLHRLHPLLDFNWPTTNAQPCLTPNIATHWINPPSDDHATAQYGRIAASSSQYRAHTPSVISACQVSATARHSRPPGLGSTRGQPRPRRRSSPWPRQPDASWRSGSPPASISLATRAPPRTAVMSVFNRLARKFTSGIFCFRLVVPMQACAVEGGH
jgi:hypothetical protein